ncbi:solute carrier family 2, facilitated glucose transporter member 1-like isoform X2 [Leptopilina boulardi]|uniref:solute carrier family 2, facilitated glucose transporter member 1-like isoform X2 n=1 Tax=Leptopilina boulardi TaxID=63433 RepID=UPI0021F5E31A|nr:solute carrier family 2, facilitated glucose transporter member 1-like isoform X2 [Leptopilina boulardi]
MSMDSALFLFNIGEKRKPALIEGLNANLMFAIAAAALGSSFQHGYNTGVIANSGKVLKEWISDRLVERNESPESLTFIFAIIVSIFCLGGMVGGCSVGYVADRFGRKGGLLLNNILVFLTVLFEGLAKPTSSYYMFIIGRFIIGINSGLNAGLAPMYLSEISPSHLRGAVGTIYQLIITISILVAQILGLDGLFGTPTQWPTLFCLTAVPAIFQLVTLPFCPESPKYLLLTRGRDLDSQRAMSWLRGSIDVQDEMDEMRTEYESMKLVPAVSLKELIMNASLRIPLQIAVMMMIAQQMSGINAIVFFSTKIFTMAGLNDSTSQMATLGVGAVNVFMTIVSLFLVERAGRKTLLLTGFAGMTVVTFLLAIMLPHAKTSAFATYGAILMVILFFVLFATGPGSIPWFLVTELFNQSARPVATSVAIGVNWTANFFVSFGFEPIEQSIHHYVFYIFAVLQALFTFYIFKQVPETRNKSIEEISSLFRQRSYQ